MISGQPLLLYLAIFLGCAILTGLMTAAQAALHHINRARLRHLVDDGQSRWQALLAILEEPNSLFTGIAFIGTLAILVASAIGALIAYDLWQIIPALGVVVGVLLFLVLVSVQVAMRALAMHHPERWGYWLFRPVLLLTRILTPILIPLVAFERLLLRLLGVATPTEAPAASEDELRLLVEEQNSVLEKDERQMIQGIFEMDERAVREIMVPRLDITALPQRSSVGDAAELAIETGYTRLPVYAESLDNIVGVLVVKDLMAPLKAGNLGDSVAPLLRPGYFVPETKKTDELLRELQEKHVQMAIVVDEYGGTAGLITLEDLVEEIVGEIQDEYDTEEALYERVNEGEAIFDARASIHDVNEIMDLHLEDQEFDTLGGLVYDRLGKVPVVGDEVRVNGCSVTVLSTHGRRVMKVRIRVVQPQDQPSETTAA